MPLHEKLSFLHMLFLENKVQIDQNNDGMMLFMSWNVLETVLSHLNGAQT